MWTLSFTAVLAASDTDAALSNNMSFIALVSNFCRHSSLPGGDKLLTDVPPALWMGKLLRRAVEYQYVVSALNSDGACTKVLSGGIDDMDTADEELEGHAAELTGKREDIMTLEQYIHHCRGVVQKECLRNCKSLEDANCSLMPELLHFITQPDVVTTCMDAFYIENLSVYTKILLWTAPVSR
jgi:hypothetical protein